MKPQTDHFAHKSKSWDMSSRRVQNAKRIEQLITERITLTPTMEVMDLGAGTGLLSYFVAPHIGKVIALDNSPSMLKEFQDKSSEFACPTEVIEADLSQTSPHRTFDGIISSMTIHHLEDTHALFSKLYGMLPSGGFIAIADLDLEDGSFHSDNLGVYHYGFEREALEAIAQEVGFREIAFTTANTIEKPHASFSVFLMTAIKP